jgi:formyltetrahydrofolate synthetase
MRTEYYAIYQNLLQTYEIQPQVVLRTGPFASINVTPDSIMKLVDAAAATAGVADRLRPDARYFLTINLMQMVVLPVSQVGAPQDDANNILADVQADAITILRAAGEEQPNEEVSGHAVIDALSKSWDKLRTVARNIWG